MSERVSEHLAAYREILSVAMSYVNDETVSMDDIVEILGTVADDLSERHKW